MFSGCGWTAIVAPPDRSLAEITGRHDFGPRPTLLSPSEIHGLTAAQASEFLEYFTSSERADQKAHARVAGYVQRLTAGFHYRGQTLVASQALELKSGNCMSLAVLTTALARLAGVEVGYQLVTSAPVFEWHGDVVYRGLHVSTLLYDPNWKPDPERLTIRRPRLRIDYFPDAEDELGRPLTYEGYLALFYTNLAGEAVRQGELGRAFWLVKEALSVAPEDAAALNAMAVVFRRAGDEAAAERLFRYGIQRADPKLSLLRNYRVLLKRQARHREADKVSLEIALLEADNPVDLLMAAEAAVRRGAFDAAVTLFEKAAERAPYMHEPHFGMARAFFGWKRYGRAEHALARAVRLAGRSQSRAHYEAKLTALRHLRSVR